MKYSKQEIRDIITAAATEHNVNPEVLYKMASVESNFKADAVSPKGAQGWFQFMPATAKTYGVQDPTDLSQAAQGAAKYMADNLKKYNGDYELSLVDYNGGPRAVKNYVAGKPFAESAGYTQKILGDGTVRGSLSGQPMPQQPQGSVFGTNSVPTGIDNNTLARQQNLADQRNTLGTLPGRLADAAGLAFETENSAYAFFTRSPEESQTDPDFVLTEDIARQYAGDVPEDYRDFILSGQSVSAIKARRERYLSNQEKREQLYAQGAGPAVAATILAAGLDVPTLAGFIPFVGTGATFARLGRVGNIAANAAIGAVAGAGVEAAAGQFRPLAETSDVVIAGLAGGAVGSWIGATAKIAPNMGPELDAIQEAARRELIAIGAPTPPMLPAISERIKPKPRDLAVRGVDDVDMEILDPVAKATGPRLGGPGMDIEGEARFIDGEPLGLPGPRAEPGAPIQPESPLGIGMNKPPLLGVDKPVIPTGKPDDVPVDVPTAPIPTPPPKPKRARRTAPWKKDWDTPRFLKPFQSDLAKDPSGNDMLGIGKGEPVLILPEIDDLKGLGDYIEKYSKNDAYKELLKRITKDLNLSDIKLNIEEKMGRVAGEVGRFRLKHGSSPTNFFKQISLTRGSGFNERTMLHELVHYITGWHLDQAQFNLLKKGRPVFDTNPDAASDSAGFIKAMQSNAELMAAMDPKKVAAAEEMVKLFDFVRANVSGKARTHYENYGLKNVHEFTTMVLTSKSFQDMLRGLKLPGAKDNMFKAFAKKFATMIGLGTDDSALKKAFQLFDEMAGETDLMKKGDELRDKSVRAGNDWASKKAAATKAAKTPEELDASLKSINAEQFVANNPEAKDSVFGFGMGLEDRLMNANIPVQVRELAGKLFGTTKGYKGRGVVKESVWDEKLKLQNGWKTGLNKAGYAGFDKFYKDKGYKFYQTTTAKSEFQKDMYRLIHGKVTPEEVHPGVVEAVAAWRKTMRDVVDNINNPAKGTGGQKRGLTQKVETDADGNEVLTAPLDYNDNYVPRSADTQKWHQMTNEFGKEFMNDFFAQAFKRATPDMDDAKAAKLGEWYVKAVEDAKLNREESLLDAALSGQDKDWLAGSLRKFGVDDSVIDDIMSAFNPKSKQGSPTTSNLKFRALLDENTEVTLENGRVVSFEDFFNTDVLALGSRYLDRMAGSISMANKLDVYSTADETKLISGVLNREFGSSVTDGLTRRMKEDLDFAMAQIMGRPLEDMTKFTKSAEMFRNYNVASKMTMAVLNQIQEMAQIIGTMGLKAVLQAVPELKGFMRDARTGKLKSEFLDEFESLIDGAGNDLLNRIDWSANDDWVRTFGDSSVNQWLDKADNVSRKMADGVLKGTGMTGMMSQQKRIHAIALINHFHAAALGKKKLAFSADRLKWMGLEVEDTGKILGSLKQYTKQKSNGRVDTVDFAKWHTEDPDSYHKFMTAFQRESRRVVQENDLASTVPFMGKTLGKTFFQFMNFTIQAWNKQMMFAANYRDIETVQTMLWGIMMSSIVYTGRTYMDSLGRSDEERQKFLDERLNLGQVVRSSVGRIPQASLLPSMIDSLSPVPLFSGMRTTTEKTDLLANPTTDLISTLMATVKRAGKQAIGEEDMTEGDYRAALKMLPLSNGAGISQILNAIAADLGDDDLSNLE